jgi:hypothetical protein
MIQTLVPPKKKKKRERKRWWWWWWRCREKRFTGGMGSQTAPQFVFGHLQGIDISFRFKQRKNWGRGREVCIIKQSWSKCSPIISVLVFWGFWRSCYCCHHSRQAIWFSKDDYSRSRVHLVYPARLHCSIGVVWSLVIKMLLISPVLPGSQVSAKRMA